MVSAAAIEQRLKQLGFKPHGWGRAEVAELRHILVPGEEIYECVNGVYEGGFALLVATDVRVLLVDKKPLNYLTVEDLRFDMINEIDYSHRLTGARINIATGSKNLRFLSYNQPRLRKLITHIQHCMAEAKKQQSSHQEDQNQHLEQINQQLQAYLMAQYQQQLQLSQQAGADPVAAPTPVRPSPELSDYLLARSLLAQHDAETAADTDTAAATAAPQSTAAELSMPVVTIPTPIIPTTNTQLNDIYSDGLQEVFGKHRTTEIIINPLRVAYGKLPMILRGRRYGRLSLATR